MIASTRTVVRVSGQLSRTRFHSFMGKRRIVGVEAFPFSACERNDRKVSLQSDICKVEKVSRNEAALRVPAKHVHVLDTSFDLSLVTRLQSDTGHPNWVWSVYPKNRYVVANVAHVLAVYHGSQKSPKHKKSWTITHLITRDVLTSLPRGKTPPKDGYNEKSTRSESDIFVRLGVVADGNGCGARLASVDENVLSAFLRPRSATRSTTPPRPAPSCTPSASLMREGVALSAIRASDRGSRESIRDLASKADLKW